MRLVYSVFFFFFSIFLKVLVFLYPIINEIRSLHGRTMDKYNSEETVDTLPHMGIRKNLQHRPSLHIRMINHTNTAYMNSLCVFHGP